jgi:hypothetical protein
MQGAVQCSFDETWQGQEDCATHPGGRHVYGAFLARSCQCSTECRRLASADVSSPLLLLPLLPLLLLVPCCCCPAQTYLPLDLRTKKTRAIRRRLSKEQVRVYCWRESTVGGMGLLIRQGQAGITPCCDVLGWVHELSGLSVLVNAGVPTSPALTGCVSCCQSCAC